MASWDFESADSHKCPGCGSNMLFEPKLDRVFCRNCGSFYKPDTLELSGALTNYDTDDASTEEEDKQEIICNSCGAAIVTDKYTSATFCAFCGSSALINKRLTKQFRPDYIIPFKVTREEAEKKFFEWGKTKKVAPKGYLSKGTVEKMTGLYVPFWLVDGMCHLNMAGSGTVSTNTKKEVYNIERAADFRMRRVPFDGSKAIDNFIMKAIEPFDYSEMVPFSAAYLQGFFARRYDETPK